MVTGARISPQNLDHSLIISPKGNCVKFNLFDHWDGGGEILSEQVLISLFPSGIILARYELHSPFWIRIKILSQTRNGDVKGALLDDTVMSLAVSQAERRSRMAGGEFGTAWAREHPRDATFRLLRSKAINRFLPVSLTG